MYKRQAIDWQPGKFIHGFHTTSVTAGSNYSSAPTVTVNNTGTNGTGLAVTAVMAGSGSTQTLASLTITNPGSGYTTAPTLSFSGGGGSGAAATLQYKRGLVTGYNSLDEQITVDRQADIAPFQVGDVIGNTDGYATIGSFTNKVINEVALNAGSIIPANTTSLMASVAINCLLYTSPSPRD